MSRLFSQLTGGSQCSTRGVLISFELELSRFSLSHHKEGENKERAVAIGSGLPSTVPVLAPQFLSPGQPLSPGQTGPPSVQPHSAVGATETARACVCKLEGGQQSVPESPARSRVASSSHTACCHSRPCPGSGPVQRALGGGLCPAGVWEPLVPSRQGGVCSHVLVLRMIEHLHPSVVSGPSSFPASLASAYLSPAALGQPIHHTDWCSPHQFSCFPSYPNLSQLHRFS